MKLVDFENILDELSDFLHIKDILAVYLYGSQISFIRSFGILPKGKEIDLILIKKGFLKDGEAPINKIEFQEVFSNFPKFIITFNGIWQNIKFNRHSYFLDIIGEGSQNIIKNSPSCKVINIKEKIQVWGNDIFEEYFISALNVDDKEYLKNIMGRYVRREFFQNNIAYNRTAIYKNYLFIISLINTELLKVNSRDELNKLIKKSATIPSSMKTSHQNIMHAYLNNDFETLKKEFLFLIRHLKYE